MRQSVLDHFNEFTQPLEGRVHWLYIDTLGLVTTGVGNLVDPVSLAQELPWKLPDGSSAPADRIAAEWHALKGRQELKRLSYVYAAAVTTIRLTDADIDALVLRKLLENERILRGYFPAWDEWPADAQLAACSMAWAVGAGFPHIFGNFTHCANARDWTGARAACDIRTENNPGIVPRNAANKLCLQNAADVEAQGLSPELLCWPLTVAASQAERDDELRRLAELVLARQADRERDNPVTPADSLNAEEHDTDPAPPPSAPSGEEPST